MIYMLIIIILALLIHIGYAEFNKRRDKTASYHIIVKFIGGSKTRLMLNEQQYEGFGQWISQPEGIYTIKDDEKDWKQQLILHRQNVVSVEVRKR